MSFHPPFSILWLEDDDDFMDQIADKFHDLFIQFRTSHHLDLELPDSYKTLNTARYLHHHGIDWATDESALLQAARQKQYQLIIVDMKIKNRLSGWETLEKIKGLPSHGAPSIWILTYYSHLRIYYEEYSCADRFFQKTPLDLQRLFSTLYRQFLFPLCPSANDQTLIHLPAPSGQTYQLDPKYIISIESTDGIHKIYMYNESGHAANIVRLGGGHLINNALEQIQQLQITHLIQISRSIIINTRYIEECRNMQRIHEVKLAQRNSWLPITNTYWEQYKELLDH